MMRRSRLPFGALMTGAVVTALVLVSTGSGLGQQSDRAATRVITPSPVPAINTGLLLEATDVQRLGDGVLESVPALADVAGVDAALERGDPAQLHQLGHLGEESWREGIAYGVGLDPDCHGSPPTIHQV